MRVTVCAVLVAMFFATPSAAREIALSFDDAPSGKTQAFTGPERAKTLINKLDSLGIDEVVFFCVTNRLQWNDGKWRLNAYAEAGHIIANHSDRHRRPNEIGAQAYLDDIASAHEQLKDFATFRQWFRYPYLDQGKTVPVRDSIRAGLREMGYQVGYVTVDTYDSYLNRRYTEALTPVFDPADRDGLRDIYVTTICDGADFYADMAVEVLGREVKHVLLLHENDLAALYVDELVTELRARGWEIISPTEAYADPLVHHDPDVLINNQGRVAAIAAERGHPGPYRHESESVDYLDALIEATGALRNPAAYPKPAKTESEQSAR